MFFINATNWRKDIAEQILNNDAVMIIDKNKYQQLIGQHQQMLFDNKQIAKFIIIVNIIFVFLFFVMYKMLCEQIKQVKFEFLKEVFNNSK